MSTELEEHLSAGMRESVGGIRLAGDILGQATLRHRRRTAVLRTAYALGVFGLAGALAAGIATDGAGGRDQGRTQARPPAVSAEPAALRLAAAATASDNISYRVRQTHGTRYQVRSTAQLTWEGAFDPRTTTGYLRQVHEHGILTELLIGGTRYIGTEPPAGGIPSGTHEAYSRYGQYPGKYDRLSYGLTTGEMSDLTANPDPASLLKVFRDANAAITENPDGSFHIEFTRGTDPDNGSTYRCDVTLNPEHRVAKVACTITWRSTAKGPLDSGTGQLTTELFDYGTPVTVARPADVVLVD